VAAATPSFASVASDNQASPWTKARRERASSAKAGEQVLQALAARVAAGNESGGEQADSQAREHESQPERNRACQRGRDHHQRERQHPRKRDTAADPGHRPQGPPSRQRAGKQRDAHRVAALRRRQAGHRVPGSAFDHVRARAKRTGGKNPGNRRRQHRRRRHHRKPELKRVRGADHLQHLAGAPHEWRPRRSTGASEHRRRDGGPDAERELPEAESKRAHPLQQRPRP
jgi:hypothetical protein